MSNDYRPQVGFNTDMDADQWMHTDDPDSVRWIVTVVGKKTGDDSPRVIEPRSENWPYFPARGNQTFLSAWSIPDFTQGKCHIEIDDGDGNVHLVGTCPHQPDGAVASAPLNRP
ncbi:hypothetical protein [Nocardioides sp. CER19]|uniref:hypothetical protein n=1 Tax=Nocardioides sp. CER19 TaxID=3038538 RepID=UPI002447C474|nr:hypothetical protein [Nocardioides sp. CER19]MDH2415808.1 hypothetical protein [Nocardioides sp. CER19]